MGLILSTTIAHSGVGIRLPGSFPQVVNVSSIVWEKSYVTCRADAAVAWNRCGTKIVLELRFRTTYKFQLHHDGVRGRFIGVQLQILSKCKREHAQYSLRATTYSNEKHSLVTVL